MAKKLIGMEIGNYGLKLALKKEDAISVYTARLPENLMVDGRIKLPESMSDFISEVRAKAKLPRSDCSFVLPDSVTVCRRLKLPMMTEEQLALNLPYELRDFIQGNDMDYKYDYAVLNTLKDEEGNSVAIELMAAAVSKKTLDEYYQTFRRAGLDLKIVLPREMAYVDLIRKYERSNAQGILEYCFVDLGHTTTRIHIYSGTTLMAARKIEIGGATINAALADYLNIDEYLVEIRKCANADNIQTAESSVNVYRQIAIEILKAINFYRYNNSESQLADVYFLGGGAAISLLKETISSTIELQLHDISEMIPHKMQGIGADVNIAACALAAIAAEE